MSGPAPTPINSETAKDSTTGQPVASTAANEGGPIDEGAGMTKSAAKKLAKQEALLAKKAGKISSGKPKSAAEGGSKKEKKAAAAGAAEPKKAFVNTTPKGQKKDLSEPIGDKEQYDPIAVESAWYDWWVEKGYFKPQFEADGSPKKAGTFVIPAPPPNVTGSLHIGHALAIALQDALIRWNRMLGKTVLFNPGYDHAGISTQSVVEKRLLKATGKSRHDLGREAFLKKVWEWKEEYQTRISLQAHRLGASYDWDRVAFTMDERLSKAVVETFVRLHDEGTIYRANRLVNWCVRLQTVLSNEEVDDKEIPGRQLISVPGYDNERVEVGVITSIAYEIEGSTDRLVIATTRPETLLGDTAIAVHPDDERYKHLHGKRAVHPFLPRTIPIITDAEAVDMAFGTGAVKITPAHDANDYEVGKRHNLEFINILNDDGTMNDNAGPKYAGMKRYHVRRQILQDLKEKGLYVEAKDNPMNIGICQKSGDIIEPVIKPQWYVSCKPIAEEIVKRSKTGEILIRPALDEADWYRWLENIQDWCISRQLWWGHRCPVYRIIFEGETGSSASEEEWVAGHTEDEASQKAQKKHPGKTFTLKQDDDVLDTWFSSGLWPFSIHGWPEKTDDLAHFYPASLLETGWDILFFWVIRMAIFGIKLTGQFPFPEVFCHPLIRDAEGRKMSKSLGNVIDPLDVAEGISLQQMHAKLLEGNLDPKELKRAQDDQKKTFGEGIPQCGIDALRFTLCNYTGQGRTISLDVKVIEGYRKFCNKLWNAYKFASLKFEKDFVPAKSSKPSGKESLVDKWILHRLNEAAKEVNKQLEARYFMHSTSASFEFWLKELCDVYIEAIKPTTDEKAPPEARRAAQDTLYTCLDLGLRLLHPFMPYITEELWQRLPRRPNDKTETIVLAAFPVDNPDFNNPGAASDFELANSLVLEVRSMAATYNLFASKTPVIEAYIEVHDDARRSIVAAESAVLKSMIKWCKSFKVVKDRSEIPAGCATTAIGTDAKVHVLVKGLADIDLEIKKLEGRQQAAEAKKAALLKQTSVEGYESKIPQAVQNKNKDALSSLDAELETIRKGIENFKLLGGDA